MGYASARPDPHGNADDERKEQQAEDRTSIQGETESSTWLLREELVADVDRNQEKLGA